MKTKDRKSPLKKRPPATPGQSLGEEISDFFYRRMMIWFLVITFALAFTLQAWFRHLFPSDPLPCLITAISVVVTAVALWQIRKLIPYGRQLILGQQGEQYVGQLLEQLRADGYNVYHDIAGNGYNIDHVLIGPGGVFVIETKTRTKPKGAAEITYDGQRVRVNGHKPDRDPIVQAKAAAREIKRLIDSAIGRDQYVRPVVLYPGWFVRKTGSRGEVWVFNENFFMGWIANEHKRLDEEAIRKISASLEMSDGYV